tara:strand:- start:279 stop:989 length:711 start_codon:yes stop_codon:yes gene_type:complete
MIQHLSIATLFLKIKYYFLQKKYKKNSHPKVFDFQWSKKGFNRISVVNHLISISGGLEAKYLEVGCQGNKLFDSVASLHKVGVDPETGGTHKMTSDKFFENNDKIFDVVFIDGLHTYEQVHRDAVNALNCIGVGGYIAFHDFLPKSWKEHHVPRINHSWTGDCWKLAIQLAEAKGLEFVIIDVDCGVGLLKKLSHDYNVPNVSDKLEVAEFEKFVSIFDKLPILSYESGIRKMVKA